MHTPLLVGTDGGNLEGRFADGCVVGEREYVHFNLYLVSSREEIHHQDLLSHMLCYVPMLYFTKVRLAIWDTETIASLSTSQCS
jgi:hypothetical protein